MEKILSLCISTYNRAEYLDQLLNSIFEQIRDVPAEKIELCINDDSADDKAQHVVDKYREQNLVDLKYHRNHANTGMDKAFLSVVEMSLGKYCWIISDDDLMVSGALKKVFETILYDKYDLVIGERNFFVEKHNYQLERQWNLQDNIFDNATEYNKILTCGFWASTYICSLIFNRDLWFYSKFRDADISRFRYFIHIRKIFDALPHSNKSTIFLSKPLMAARGDAFSYTSNSLKVWFYYLFNVLRSLDLYSEETIEDCSKKISEEMAFLVVHTNLLRNKVGVNDVEYHLNWNIYFRIRKNMNKKQRLNCLIAILMSKSIIKSLLLPNYLFDDKFYELLKRYRLLKMIGYILYFFVKKNYIKLGDKKLKNISGKLLTRVDLHLMEDNMQKVKVEDNKPFINTKNEKIKVAMISTWNSKCGIAEYTKKLCTELREQVDFTLYPNYGVQLIEEDDNNIACRCWRNAYEGDLNQLTNEILNNYRGEIVHIQFSPEFFDIEKLARFIEAVHFSKKVVVTLHKVKDFTIKNKTVSLKSIKDQLNVCHKLLVLQKMDIELLIDMGVNRDVIMAVPIGQIGFSFRERRDIVQKLHIRNGLVLGSYGFLLPHKGIIECIEAVSLVKNQFPDVLYLICCSHYDNPISESYFEQCKKVVYDKGLRKNIIFITEFLNNEQSVTILQACNFLLMNYNPSAEPASGAIRFCVAAMRPIMTTRQDVFAEYSDCTYQIDSCNPELIAKGILKLKDDIELQNKLMEKMKSVADNTSWTRVAETVDKIYKETPTKILGEQIR